MKKYLTKDTYLQKKDNKLSMKWEGNSMIMEYQKIIEVSKKFTAK